MNRKEMLKALKELKEECEKNEECEGCRFNSGSMGGVCVMETNNAAPCNWETNE